MLAVVCYGRASFVQQPTNPVLQGSSAVRNSRPNTAHRLLLWLQRVLLCAQTQVAQPRRPLPRGQPSLGLSSILPSSTRHLWRGMPPSSLRNLGCLFRPVTPHEHCKASCRPLAVDGLHAADADGAVAGPVDSLAKASHACKHTCGGSHPLPDQRMRWCHHNLCSVTLARLALPATLAAFPKDVLSSGGFARDCDSHCSLSSITQASSPFRLLYHGCALLLPHIATHHIIPPCGGAVWSVQTCLLMRVS